jgi:glutamate/tyrosine decarboxylase-like PLP-dependent enzyme
MFSPGEFMDANTLQALFRSVADHAAERRSGDADRIHRPVASYKDLIEHFRLNVDDEGAPANQVMADIIRFSEPGLAAMTGPRFHGWVIGGSHPVGVAADWLAGAWGQNTVNPFATPSASAVEAAAASALLDLLDLPRESSVGFVTGGTMANFTCLAAARGEVLRRAGWDVEANGLFGAPPITVIIGEEAHSTVFVSLKYLGLGANRVIKVAVDNDGAMLPDAFATAMKRTSGPVIAIAQAGQINSGAIDRFPPIVAAAREKGAWLHVDGAFGLWARATPDRAHLAAGIDEADSWAVDGHKWLQTPYDCGYAIVRDQEAHTRAMQIAASYLPGTADGERTPGDYVPELSRRARGLATWALIRHLGRKGIAEMISRHCAFARRFADRLGAEPGVEILNTVTLNQVTVRFGDDELTRRTIARIQSDGVCFVSGSEWRGHWVMRISVIGGATTEADVDRSIAAMLSAWRAVSGRN